MSIFFALFDLLHDILLDRSGYQEQRDFYSKCPSVFRVRIYGRGGSDVIYVDSNLPDVGMHGYISDSSRGFSFRDKEAITIEKSPSLAGIIHPSFNYVATSSSDKGRIQFFPKFPKEFLEDIKKADGRW